MAQKTEVAPSQKQTWGKGRRITFYTMIALSLLSMFIAGPILTLPVTAWLSEPALDALFDMDGLGIHRIHLQGASLLFWLTVVAMVAQFRKPETKAAPLWAAAAGWVAFLPLELTHLVDPYSIVVTCLVVGALLVHPRRWPSQPLGRRSGSGLLAVPFAGAATVYAVQQAAQQLYAVSGEPHAVVSHYELMTGMAVGLAVAALLGATNFPGRLISAWTAGILTLVFAIFCIGYPNQTSSVGSAWGVVLVVWSLIYMLTTVRPRREPK